MHVHLQGEGEEERERDVAIRELYVVRVQVRPDVGCLGSVASCGGLAGGSNPDTPVCQRRATDHRLQDSFGTNIVFVRVYSVIVDTVFKNAMLRDMV